MELNLSEINLACGSSNGLKKSIKAWELVNNKKLLDNEREMMHGSTVNGHRLEIVNGVFPENFISEFPLPGYSLLKMESHEDELFYDSIGKAVDFIWSNFGNEQKNLIKHLSVIFPVTNLGHERQITSLSVPNYPFSCFISKNAAFHLAPDIINREGGVFYLAENIFHEMVHNQVNIDLLELDLLHPSYNSDDSPKIEIEWRRTSNNTKQTWQVDRAVHALWVYSYLVKFRYFCNTKKPTLFTEKMIDDAKSKANYLQLQLLKLKSMLTSEGVDYIASATHI